MLINAKIIIPIIINILMNAIPKKLVVKKLVHSVGFSGKVLMFAKKRTINKIVKMLRITK